MIISLQLLQMPINELQECIEKELEENPLLEIDYEGENNTEEIDDSCTVEADKEFASDKLLQVNIYDIPSEISYHNDDDADDNPFNYISQQFSLKDYLKEQLVGINEEIRSICEYLIDMLNEDGFIVDDLQEIANELKVSYPLANSALHVIQELQPWGIGTKDFRESLITQLKKKNICDIKLEEIIRDHLDLLAENKLKELASVLKVTVDKVQYYTNIIKSLEPKPSRGFYTGEKIGYIIPEAYVKKIGEEYHVVMNDSILPRLNVNSYYRQIIKDEYNQEAAGFIKDNVNSAISFIKGIEQRRRTIYRILELMIIYQKDYFDKGETFLKPMNLKNLATELNLHESTISRAIKDKFICTPCGTLKLKDLFTNGISIGIGEQDISTNRIKKVMEQLIKTEDRRKPLSDQDICNLLNKDGMNISRRTVAKYREELGFRASSKRKTY
jgi:RNA polymerase sigma-54 factor